MFNKELRNKIFLLEQKLNTLKAKTIGEEHLPWMWSFIRPKSLREQIRSVDNKLDRLMKHLDIKEITKQERTYLKTKKKKS